MSRTSSVVPAAAVSSSAPRVEYLGFQNVAEDRYFRFCVSGPEGATEVRFRIAIAALGAGVVRLQDGPDVCCQKLLRALAAGETLGRDVITIDDEELASYRQAHTKVQKHRSSWTPPSPPVVETAPQVSPVRDVPKPPTLALVPDGEAILEVGQRVSHGAFGLGVTTSASRSHTVVCFDQDGQKTFVTSMLKVEVLSGPYTWETSARGRNRLRPARPID
jgi:hypothetical protein